MKKFFRCLLLILPVALVNDAFAAGLIGGELRFKGKVVSLPCSVAPGGEIIPVDFKQISVRDLIKDKTTKPVPFSIHLVDCSSAVFKSVTVKFSGVESTKMPNHLSVTPDSPGDMSAVAVGLQLKNGTPVDLNKDTPATALSNGSMSLDFRAFVEGDKALLQSGSVDFGSFSSIANYTLSYQ